MFLLEVKFSLCARSFERGALHQSTPASILFAARLQQASSAATIGDDISELSVSRVLGRDHQISVSEDGEGFQPKKLEGSFSNLFESASQKPPLRAGTFEELERLVHL